MQLHSENITVKRAYRPAMSGYRQASERVMSEQEKRITTRLRVMRQLLTRNDNRYLRINANHNAFSERNAFFTQIILSNVRREYLGI